MSFSCKSRFWPRAVLTGLLSLLGLGVAAPARAEPAMWVVRDADSTVYMLGTIHVLKPGVAWRSAKLDRALADSREYWMEADIGEDPGIAQTYVLNFGYDDKHPLSAKLGKENWARFLAAAKALNLPGDQLDRMRPWFASIALGRAQVIALGYQPDAGADITLEREVTKAGKPVKTFETSHQQLGYLAGLPEKFATEMLVQTIREIDQGPELIDALEAAWLAGDVKAVQRLGSDDMRKDAPELYDAMIVRRNAAWVKQIDALMKGSGTSFIAVGAAHLIGPDGLPTRLKALGYKVERY